MFQLFCFNVKFEFYYHEHLSDRFKTNIDGILHGSSNYIVHSYYNRSIADVQLRASSFLFELISTRDSRQSYFGNVTVTRAQLTDIINHICSS